jgi:RNA polymerase sigma-70 factor, ECF subfamily
LREQNRAHWDRLLIQRGLAALAQSERLGGLRGPYTLQAAIAGCHARAPSVEETDWERICALYAALLEVTPSPVVALNHAVAVSMARGPEAGLVLLDALAGEAVLEKYHWLPSARGDLLFRLGRKSAAQSEFERAASLTRNAREQTLLLARAAECAN